MWLHMFSAFSVSNLTSSREMDCRFRGSKVLSPFLFFSLKPPPPPPPLRRPLSSSSPEAESLGTVTVQGDKFQIASTADERYGGDARGVALHLLLFNKFPSLSLSPSVFPSVPLSFVPARPPSFLLTLAKLLLHVDWGRTNPVCSCRTPMMNHLSLHFGPALSFSGGRREDLEEEKKPRQCASLFLLSLSLSLSCSLSSSPSLCLSVCSGVTIMFSQTTSIVSRMDPDSGTELE